MLPAMSFFKRIWKSLSTGDPEIGGGDPESVAILTEEYGTDDPNVPLDSPTAPSPIGQGELSTLGEVGRVGREGEQAAEKAEHAPHEPAEPTP